MTYFIFYFILLTIKKSFNGMSTLKVNYFSTILFYILFWIQERNCVKVSYLHNFYRSQDLFYSLFYFGYSRRGHNTTLYEYQWYGNTWFSIILFFILFWLERRNQYYIDTQTDSSNGMVTHGFQLFYFLFYFGQTGEMIIVQIDRQQQRQHHISQNI